MRKYTILKTFNNNVLLCLSDRGGSQDECVIIGKGIGFGMKPGDEFTKTENIEKEFSIKDNSNIDKFAELHGNSEDEIVGVVEEAILIIAKGNDGELNEKIHITLLDHVVFAVERLKNNIDIKNPFSEEISLMYPKEYSVAEEIVSLINERLNIELPEAEVAFITMHIHAAYYDGKASTTAKNTTIIYDMVSFIETKLGHKIDRKSIDYIRLVTHLKFALKRFEQGITIENLLFEDIKYKFKNAFALACEMQEYIEHKYNMVIPDSELAYIALHTEKICRFENK